MTLWPRTKYCARFTLKTSKARAATCACSWPSSGAAPGSTTRNAATQCLRARHLPFKIGAKERDHWLEHMTAAVKEAHIGALDEAQMLGYFASASSHMINAPD